MALKLGYMNHWMDLGMIRQLKLVRNCSHTLKDDKRTKVSESKFVIAAWSDRGLNVRLKFEINLITHTVLLFRSMCICLMFHTLLSVKQLLLNQLGQ